MGPSNIFGTLVLNRPGLAFLPSSCILSRTAAATSSNVQSVANCLYPCQILLWASASSQSGSSSPSSAGTVDVVVSAVAAAACCSLHRPGSLAGGLDGLVQPLAILPEEFKAVLSRQPYLVEELVALTGIEPVFEP